MYSPSFGVLGLLALGAWGLSHSLAALWRRIITFPITAGGERPPSASAPQASSAPAAPIPAPPIPAAERGLMLALCLTLGCAYAWGLRSNLQCFTIAGQLAHSVSAAGAEFLREHPRGVLFDMPENYQEAHLFLNDEGTKSYTPWTDLPRLPGYKNFYLDTAPGRFCTWLATEEGKAATHFRRYSPRRRQFVPSSKPHQAQRRGRLQCQGSHLLLHSGAETFRIRAPRGGSSPRLQQLIGREVTCAGWVLDGDHGPQLFLISFAEV